MKLAAVPSKNKELHRANKGFDRFGETTGLANEAFEIVTQFGIHPLDAEGLTFVGHGGMGARGIEECFVGGKQVAVVPHRLGRSIEQRLEGRFVPLNYDLPAHNTTGFSLNKGHKVESVFFLPTKVNNSSISTMWSGFSSGTGACASWSLCALTQFMTVT